jgi:hypothetical protein
VPESLIWLLPSAAVFAVWLKWLAFRANAEDAAKAANHQARAARGDTAEQREHHRAWIKHAREQGATEVRVWSAHGVYDDPTEVDVSVRETLATLAEHTGDAHLDAVGRHDGKDVTVYLSEWTEAAV